MTTTAPSGSPRLWAVALLLAAVLADLAASFWMAAASHRWLPVAASAAAGPVVRFTPECTAGLPGGKYD